jgi:hypothetical protein
VGPLADAPNRGLPDAGETDCVTDALRARVCVFGRIFVDEFPIDLSGIEEFDDDEII